MPSGDNLVPISNGPPPLEDALAEALFRALSRGSPYGFVSGDIERAVIDGSFNLQAILRLVLWGLRGRL
jgi:hypothetical protein